MGAGRSDPPPFTTTSRGSFRHFVADGASDLWSSVAVGCVIAGGAPDARGVGTPTGGPGIVDDGADVTDVQPPGRHVRCHQERLLGGHPGAGALNQT